MYVISSSAYRPTRKIYYMNTTRDDIDNFYNGIIPEKILKYKGSFGTYGYPGLFIIKKENMDVKVIGIEYRPDDSRISYPEGLEEISIPTTFFRSEILVEDNEEMIDDEMVMNYVDMLCKSEKSYQNHVGGRNSVKQNPEIIQIFVSKGQTRVLVESLFVLDDTIEHPNDDDTSKYKELYYHDFITGYNNWNYIWPRMALYNYYGVQDYSLVFFDVKDFKAINVVYGHLVGNQVLVDITKQMEKMDWIYYSARCDNDNFAMMIKDMPEEEIREKLEKFFESISYLEQDKNYRVYYRCGVVPRV